MLEARPLDLDALDREMDTHGQLHHQHVRALIAELRASRKVVEAADHLSALLTRGPVDSYEEGSAILALNRALAEVSTLNAISAESWNEGIDDAEVNAGDR